jgi:3-oxoadipate enol-lactonase
LPAKYVTVAGVAVHYVHSGPTTLPDVAPALDRGRLFVLVHGAGGNAWTWRRQIEGLGATDSVVALDFPGHGRSAGLDGLGTVEDYADFLDQFLGAIGARPAVIVGRSMGGAIGMVLAVRRPERVTALVLSCSTAHFDVSPQSVASLRDVVRGRIPQQFRPEMFSPSCTPDVMREAFMEQVKTDPRVRLGDLLACERFDGRPLLAQVKVPTLVVAGADDKLTPPSMSEELAAGIEGARLEVLEKAGHMAASEQGDAFNALVGDFARGLR